MNEKERERARGKDKEKQRARVHQDRVGEMGKTLECYKVDFPVSGRTGT